MLYVLCTLLCYTCTFAECDLQFCLLYYWNEYVGILNICMYTVHVTFVDTKSEAIPLICITECIHIDLIRCTHVTISLWLMEFRISNTIFYSVDSSIVSVCRSINIHCVYLLAIYSILETNILFKPKKWLSIFHEW